MNILEKESLHKNTVYFLETLPQSGACEFEGIMIALMPQVAYELLKRKKRFFTLSDFSSIDSANSDNNICSGLFYQWLDLMDAKLMGIFKALKVMDIKPAATYGYYLKLLIDHFTANAIKIKAVFEKIKPKQVIFICSDKKEQLVDYQLILKGCSIFSILLPFFCQLYKIPYSEQRFSSLENIKSYPGYRQVFLQIARRIKASILDYLYGLKIYPRQPAMLILNSGWGIEEIKFSAWKKGYRCLSRIKKYHWQGRQDLPDFDTARLIATTEIFDRLVATGFSKLFSHRIRYFIEEICPNFERAAQYYFKFFAKENIKIVIAPHKTQFDDFPIMAAATHSKNTISIQVHHGYSATHDTTWQVSEQPCDLWLTYDPEIKGHFSRFIFNKPGVNNNIEVARLWTTWYKKIRQRRLRKNPQKIVLYLPTISMIHVNRFADVWYGSPRYFEYQLDLLKYFSSEKDFFFIYKDFPSGPMLNIFKRVIKDYICSNVIYANDRLYKYLPRVDYVIVDLPSTPIYEAVLASVPAFCLYHKSIQVRDSAKEFFGKIFQEFTTSAEAIATIRLFLNGDPGDYIRERKECDGNAFKIIEHHLRLKEATKTNKNNESFVNFSTAQAG